MVFALRRDVSSAGELGDKRNAGDCATRTGVEPGTGALIAGKVRLKDCKRPRPLVLRARAGDILRINLTNLLRPAQPGISKTFCRTQPGNGVLPNITDIRAHVSTYPTAGDAAPLCKDAAKADEEAHEFDADVAGAGSDFPRTRTLSFVVPGIEPIPGPKDGGIIPVACKGLGAIEPDDTITCHYRLDREGTHLFQSMAAAAGGEGDGGSFTHGLFGALIVEPKGSSFYRSQVPMAAFDNVWQRNDAIVHARVGTPEYEMKLDADRAPTVKKLGVSSPCDADAMMPVANMLRDCGTDVISLPGRESQTLPVREIVHGDINAIIVPPLAPAAEPGGAGTLNQNNPYEKPIAEPFREFVVIFHDELKSFYTKEMESLGSFEQFSGIGDGFGINYGASGAGSIVLANKLKIGPAADCPECAYEEFFLGSWANGDPALLESFVDDPSNVHHSYLNDRVVFRNFHAGPKETHVFHLHSHQWFAGNDRNRGAYLDSQTIGPQQGMSYDIYGGGTEIYRAGPKVDGKLQKGWYETLGSGNRNRTPGDAIFHCHLYPHFAQGMWELWRVHDVLEDGTRTLPDGQFKPGLSLDPRRDPDERKMVRSGTPTSGEGPVLWAAWDDKQLSDTEKASYLQEGTPIPGLLPVPSQAAPLLPTYDAAETKIADLRGFPGYPFYVAGEAGHRAPQPPMDIAVKKDKRMDGGLGRHIVTGGERIRDVATRWKAGEISLSEAEAAGLEIKDGVPYYHHKIVPVTVAQMLALGDLTEAYHKLEIELLPPDGTVLERNAMAFHHKGLREGVTGDRLLLRNANGVTLASVPGDSSGALPVIPPVPAPGAPATDRAAYNSAVEARAAASGYASVYLPSPLAGPSDPADPIGVFAVNGAAPRPGSPFADPCGAPDGLRNSPFRDPYKAAGSTGSDAYPYFNKRHKPYRSILAGGADKFGNTFGSYPPKEMTYDPGLSGFRRFEASVVQFDMIVNKAGWHDPMARINVLTENSDKYKPAVADQLAGPRAVSGEEEPFYFRAFSGDCIEFRHTNETPHKLDLDDFQTKVPTDTIGQHIHLVKFDVTSSDGSGNGFNYEDGTFAPDELKERIHAANRKDKTDGDGTGWLAHPDNAYLLSLDPMLGVDPIAFKASVAPGSPWQEKCGRHEEIWKLRRMQNPTCFQTTVQRWFADPILANTGENGGNAAPVADRTLRTVFTHDHFAPSNIQQHGFYNALLIEPATKIVRVYESSQAESGTEQTVEAGKWVPVAGSASGAHEPELIDVGEAGKGVGAKARVETPPTETANDAISAQDPYHPDYREFALAIADFALLYDGYNVTDSKAALEADSDDAGLDGGGNAKGLDRLIKEARVDYRAALDDANAKQTEPLRRASDICEYNRGRAQEHDKGGNELTRPEGVETLPPAQAVACEIHEERTAVEWLAKAATQLTENYFKPIREAHGRPVYPPDRPEAISQTHHDPYLVNYRNEPMPLRVGESEGGTDLISSRKCPDFAGQSRDSVEGLLADGRADSISRQKGKELSGDMANVFRSMVHGDPCTPVLEAYADERVMFRLIQGAQEVQHVFTLEGRQFRRNVDQAYAFLARLDADEGKSNGPTRWNACMQAAETGRPWQHVQWFDNKSDLQKRPPSVDWLEYYRKLVAECDNITGLVTAQEIGISEHFEMAGVFSSDSGRAPESGNLMKFGGSGDFREVRMAALPVRDSLYHFGTVDALWNGAWGVLRIHNAPDTLDVTDCLRLAEPKAWSDTCSDREQLKTRVGDRLKPLASHPLSAASLARLLVDESEELERKRAIAAAQTTDLDLGKDREILLYGTAGDKEAASLESVFPSYPDLACPFFDGDDLPFTAEEKTALSAAGFSKESIDQKDIRVTGARFKAPHAFSALVAIEARHLREVAADGTVLNKPYANGRVAYGKNGVIYDPDGLMFVPVPIAQLGLSVEEILRAERLGGDENGRYGTLPWKKVIEEASRVVAKRGAVPYVQRFNAGDCIHLVVVNALTETSTTEANSTAGRYGEMSGNNRDGLRDLPGDAFLPRITRLNTDQIKDGDSDEQDLSTGEISGSASLAVAIPMSKMSNVDDSPEPIGVNPRRALPPMTDGEVSYAIDVMFAGTIGYAIDQLDSLLNNAEFCGLYDKASLGTPDLRERYQALCENALLPAAPTYEKSHFVCDVADAGGKMRNVVMWPSAVRACRLGEEARLNVLGRTYCAAFEADSSLPALSPIPHTGDIQQCVSGLIRQSIVDVETKVDTRLRVIPHAHGTLPVKSVSDPISHGVHGLAGTMIIEPLSATYAGRGDPVRRSYNGSAPATVRIKPQWQGGAAYGYAAENWKTVDYSGSDSTKPGTTVTYKKVTLPAVSGMADYQELILPKSLVAEMSLLWQDGLNLWDGRRRPFYHARQGGCRITADSPASDSCLAAGKRPGGPIPDCDICDDSYDRGEKGVSYDTNALFARVRGDRAIEQDHSGSPQSVMIPQTVGPKDWSSQCGWPIYFGSIKPREGKGEGSCPWAPVIDLTSDLSAWPLPSDLFDDERLGNDTALINSKAEQEIMVRIVEPQGRARQRAFVPTGTGYHDMFPGFGSGHSALIAPGKGVTAAMKAPATPGDYLWFDGPRQLMSGGTWGLMRIVPKSSKTEPAGGEN
ncbi:hypothetical protein V1T76_27880 [Roseibium sp. FZY0029]|uniref:hypothetical protein n=1 Tax=Roseibium sp. FZY0029 TaxID=3116647 RepID=UPI002EB7E911|nr:hypothetical protein [Roseibium sp. FZY0029]